MSNEVRVERVKCPTGLVVEVRLVPIEEKLPFTDYGAYCQGVWDKLLVHIVDPAEYDAEKLQKDVGILIQKDWLHIRKFVHERTKSDVDHCAKCKKVFKEDSAHIEYLVEKGTGAYHCMECAAELDEAVEPHPLTVARVALEEVETAQSNGMVGIPHIMKFMRAMLSWAEGVQEELDEEEW